MNFIIKHHRGTTRVSIGLPSPSSYSPSSTVIIVDSYFLESLHTILPGFSDFPKIIIETSESTKTLAEASRLLEDILGLNDSLPLNIISIGGGIVQDISGYVAALIRRGVRWTFIPTTLLSQGDSCIGSKISINTTNKKNSIGTFYSPSEVYIDSVFLTTLPKVEILSGIGDMLHYILLSSTIDSAFLDQSWMALDKSSFQLLPLIASKTLEIKKSYIEADEFDQTIRKHLNYGHSFGHAIEIATNFQYPHGVAVILGLNIAAYLSHCISPELGVSTITPDHKQLLFKATDLVNKLLGHPFVDFELFVSALASDKKNTSPTSLTCILPLSSGITRHPCMIKDAVSIVSLPYSLIRYCLKDYPLFSLTVEHALYNARVPSRGVNPVARVPLSEGE